MDTIDPWASKKWSQQDAGAAAVMKGLHQSYASQYDYQPKLDPQRAARSPSPPARLSEQYRDDRYRNDARFDDNARRRHDDRRRGGSHDDRPSDQPALTTLDARFQSNNPRRTPRIDDNITVDIVRKILGKPEYTVNRAFDPASVKIVRRRGEGLRPMFDRDEIKEAIAANESEIVERRVVKVVGGGGGSRHGDADYDTGRPASPASKRRHTGVTSYDQSHEGFTVKLRNVKRERSPEYR